METQYDSLSTLRRFRCDSCGYGASRQSEPARCPMCGGTVWAEEPWEPAEAMAAALAPMTREAEAAGFLPGVPLS
jgi:hypothetical protein